MGLIATIRGWLNPILAKFRAFLGAIFRGAVEETLAAMKDIAIQAVMAVAADPTLVTDESRRKEALKKLSELAEARGIQAGDSLKNLAIELAVQYFKAQK
jgi:hypothetical protein